VNGDSVSHRPRTLLIADWHRVFWGLVAALLGAGAGIVVMGGSLKLLLVLAGLLFTALSCIYPRLMFWLIVTLVVCFSEALYKVQDPFSVFRPASYVLDPFRLNVYEILVLVLFVILVGRRVLGTPEVALPRPVRVSSFALACVVLIQFARGLMRGAGYADVIHPYNGHYVLVGIIALWCFTQLLATPRVRLRFLDGLFLLASCRACYGLFGYFLGSGDAANAYRDQDVKVALWDSADHMLFVLLIVTCVAAWATRRLGRTRAMLWVPGSLLMAVTILLSFRRTGWLGLGAAVIVAAVVLARRSMRAAVLVPAIVATVAAILTVSYRRFAGAGSMLARLFPDLESRAGATRQDEWALAWRTIVRNPVFGDMLARRANSLFATWDTRFVHNAFLFAWMKFGVLGLVAAAFLVLACLAYAVKGIRSRCSEEYLALGVAGLAPFLFLVSMTGTPLMEIRMVLILALAGSLGVLVGVESDVEREIGGNKSESLSWARTGRRADA